MHFTYSILFCYSINESLHDALYRLQMAPCGFAIVSEKPMLLQTAIDKQTEVSISAVPIGILTLSDIYEAILHVETETEQAPLVLSTLKKVPSLVRSRSSTGAVAGQENTPSKTTLQGSLVTKYTNR